MQDETQASAQLAQADQAKKMEAFTFGDPTPVMDRRELLDYLECWSNGRWYEPPMSWAGLAKTFKPHRLLSTEVFSRFALDFLVFGNGYLEHQVNRLGSTLGLSHVMAKYTRRGVDLQKYFFVRNGADEHEFNSGRVFHLQEADIEQEVYGLPEYLSALQAAWLNESATLFRRRYFNNGSHAGFILYISDAAQSQGDIDGIREALKQSKGPGNFRNLFLYSPNGKKDGIQLIPVSEVAAKDDFFNIKNVSRDDVLAAHRIPPQLLGIVPSNTGGFGAIVPAAQVFATNEIEPLQARFLALNDWLGEEVVQFEKYEVTVSPAAPGGGG